MPLPLTRAALARIVPFALFMALLALRGAAPGDGSWGVDPRWVYAIGVAVVGASLLYFARDYGELFRQNRPERDESVLAVAMGLLVFGLWIQLDQPWMRIGSPSADFVPLRPDGLVDWPLVAVRFVGAALVVPLMEELFWRSFLMRWIAESRFEGVDPRRVGLRALVLSTFVFTLAHTLWLAAAIAGLAYGWLYIRTGKLWVPVISHAVTNAALGLWVVATQRWQFW